MDERSNAASEDLTVRFPDLPVTSYLRLIAWSDRAAEVIVADPTLESVARANGVRVLDRKIAQLANRCRAVFCDEAAKALRAGRTTMAPVVVAPLPLWRESLTNLDRATEWLGHMKTSPIPEPTREIETTHRRVADALRAAFS